jgi:hypothetical protein
MRPQDLTTAKTVAKISIRGSIIWEQFGDMRVHFLVYDGPLQFAVRPRREAIEAIKRDMHQ